MKQQSVQTSMFDPAPPEAHATVALRGAEKAAAESAESVRMIPPVERRMAENESERDRQSHRALEDYLAGVY